MERYAAQFSCAEINSSFHRSHRPSTWVRWRNSVPEAFRFSVKLPKTITHTRRLVDATELLDAFLSEVAHLEERLAVLLVQLPPSLAFDTGTVERFFADLVRRATVPLACEPRHASWFQPDADTLLGALGVARVAADPARVPAAAEPGGSGTLRYWRLHGSPVMYRSSYGDRITSYAEQMTKAARSAECWCIFDNTASSAATADALQLQAAMRRQIPVG
nr:DUF72 domain-containing protein [Sphingomonas arenae]